MPRRVRTILVLHNRILREGIAVHLSTCEDIELVATGLTIDVLTALFTRLRPDLVLLDLDLPPGNAVDGIKHLRYIDSQAWIIGLATCEQDECCADAIAAGAATVVAKDLIGKVLVSLIRAGCPISRDCYECPSCVELTESVVPSHTP